MLSESVRSNGGAAKPLATPPAKSPSASGGMAGWREMSRRATSLVQHPFYTEFSHIIWSRSMRWGRTPSYRCVSKDISASACVRGTVELEVVAMKVRSQITVRVGSIVHESGRGELSFSQPLLDRIRRLLHEEGFVAGAFAHIKDPSRQIIVSSSASAHPIIELRVRDTGGWVQVDLCSAVTATSKQQKCVLARRRQISELTDMLADHLSATPGIADVAVAGVMVSEERGVRRL